MAYIQLMSSLRERVRDRRSATMNGPTHLEYQGAKADLNLINIILAHTFICKNRPPVLDAIYKQRKHWTKILIVRCPFAALYISQKFGSSRSTLHCLHNKRAEFVFNTGQAQTGNEVARWLLVRKFPIRTD